MDLEKFICKQSSNRPQEEVDSQLCPGYFCGEAKHLQEGSGTKATHHSGCRDEKNQIPPKTWLGEGCISVIGPGQTYRQGVEVLVHQVVVAMVKEGVPHHYINALAGQQAQCVQPPVLRRQG